MRMMLAVLRLLRLTTTSATINNTSSSSSHSSILLMAPTTMMLVVVVSCGRYVASALGINHPPQRQIPIGALVEQGVAVLQRDFRFAVELYNNNSATSFKLTTNETSVNASDFFQFSKAMCLALSYGIFASFGLVERPVQQVSDSFSRIYNIPYISLSSPPNSGGGGGRGTTGSSPFMVFMRPLHHQATLAVIQHYEWTSIYYIYDTNEGLSRIEYIHRIHAEVNPEVSQLDIVAMRVNDVNRCHVALRRLDSVQLTGDKHIVLDMSTEYAFQAILRQIQNVGMNRINYHYFLVGLAIDELNLDDFQHGGANITGFRLVDPEFSKAREIQKVWTKIHGRSSKRSAEETLPLSAALILDAVTTVTRGLSDFLRQDPNVLRNTFRRGQVDRKSNTGNSCRSGTPSPWPYGAAFMKTLKQVKFDGATGPVVFDDRGLRKSYKMDIMELRLERVLEKIGVWEMEKGLTMSERIRPEIVRQKVPENRTRIVTTILSKPYVWWRKHREDGTPWTGNERFEGYCVELAEKIAKNIGFSYEIRLVRDGSYGEKMPNATWNGMVGELTRREADMAIAPLTISSIRERVIDFSKPFMSLGISIMIKKPEKQKPGVFSFMDPLSYEIWMCIVLSYLGVSFVLFLVSRFSPNEWQIEDGGGGQGPTFINDFTMLNSLWFSLGAFMRRGCDVCPRSLSGRIVGSAWWFFTLIIISSYTANLAAFLTIERMLTPINSADDLAKQREILYGTVDSGSSKEFFKTSNVSVYEKMWQFMMSEPDVFQATTEDGVDKVRKSKGKYAFILESPMNDYYNQRKPCNTMKVGPNLDSKGYGIATYIDSDLREKINVAVLQLMEAEVLQKLQKKWWYDKGECVIESDSKSGSTQSSLSLSNVAGIFYILICGLGLSLVVASIELLYKSRFEHRPHKRLCLHPKSSTSTSSSAAARTAVDPKDNDGVLYAQLYGPQTGPISSLDVISAHTLV